MTQRYAKYPNSGMNPSIQSFPGFLAVQDSLVFRLLGVYLQQEGVRVRAWSFRCARESEYE